METELCKLAFKYGTDKCPKIGHTYTPVYYELLKDKRESFKKVLELGIGSAYSMRHVERYTVGASILMWRDFFPNAHIYGVDIDPTTIIEGEDRITTFLLNTILCEDMDRLIEQTGSDIDLVVDDGPHSTRLQIGTARYLLPKLKQDVIYIIEDTKGPQYIKDNLPEYDCQLVVHAKKGKIDDNLVIIRKK